MSDKKEELLDKMILQYLKNQEPIGSESLKQISKSALSSATIRNYFRALEEQGFLSQPHSSSGRIPTSAALKNYWLKNIDYRTPLCVENLQIFHNLGEQLEICVVVSLEGANRLKEILNIDYRFLALIFEYSQCLLPYSTTLQRFLEELKNLDITDIQKIAFQVRANDLLQALKGAQAQDLQRFCVCVLDKVLNQKQEVFLDIIEGKIFHKIQNGIYFDDVLPPSFIGVMQDIKTANGKSGRIFCVGALDSDYTRFYEQLN